MSAFPEPMPALRDAWGLDPEVHFLNHGSFGACPRAVLARQSELRAQLERQPVLFMRELQGRLDAARASLARFVGARAADLVFVSNATQGVNTVLRSLELEAGDELLTTNHVYGACKNALAYIADRTAARLVIAAVPFPIASPTQVIEAVLAAVTPRTRLALIDHITSPTGIVFPVREIVARLRERGVETLVDGAHAPGMIDLDIDAIGAAYYTANCHKWLCAPKGAALLHVRADLQQRVRPLAISHAATLSGASRFQAEHDWTGTFDPTPWLCVADAIDCVGGLLPGGWPAVRERNRATALAARDLLCATLEVAAPAPDSMLGSLAAVPLPPRAPDPGFPPFAADRTHRTLWDRHRIEVPVMPWPAPPARLLRIAAQLYSRREDFEALAGALHQAL